MSEVVEKKLPSSYDLAKQFILSTEFIPFTYCDEIYKWEKTHYSVCKNLAAIFDKWALNSGYILSSHQISECVSKIRSLAFREGDQVPLPTWTYSNRDDGPDPHNIISFRNGLLDITTRTLYNHTPEWLCTWTLYFDYESTATCPRWLKFLNEVYEGDAERIALLQEWAGYLLSGSNMREKCLMMIGVKRSGKSTIQRILQDLVLHTATGFSLAALATPFGASTLYNKSAAFVHEGEGIGAADRSRVVETFKCITGNSPIHIDRKYRDPISVQLNTRFTIASNSVPFLCDPTAALTERILTLSHNVSFAKNVDINLSKQLEAEMPGIALWALDGLDRLNANNQFTTPKIEAQLMHKIDMNNNPTQVFISDCLLVEEKYSSNMPGINVTTTAQQCTIDMLYKKYLYWCDSQCVDPIASNWLGRELKKILPKMKYDHHNKVYIGLGIK